MDNTTRSSRKKKSYVWWSKKIDDVALEILVEQAQQGRKDDNGYKKEAYISVVNGLKERLCVVVDRDNVSNRTHTWKKEYNSMKILLDMSRPGWNPDLQRVDASDDFWRTLQESNPNLAKFRYKSLLNYANLCTIIGDDQAIGTYGATGNECRDEQSVGLTDDFDDIEIDDSDTIPQSVPMDEHPTESTTTVPSTSRTRARDESSSQRVSKKMKKDKRLEVFESSMRLVADAVREFGQTMQARSGIGMMSRLYETIRSIPGVDDEYAFTAYKTLTLDNNQAMAFLGVAPEVRMIWLRRNVGPPTTQL